MAKTKENKRNKPNSSDDMKYTAIIITDRPEITKGIVKRRLLLCSENPGGLVHSEWVDFGFLK